MLVDQLKDIEIFQSLPEETLDQLVSASKIIDLDANETLFEEGETGSSIFIILKGRLGLFKENQEIALLWQGQFFGEMAVIEAKPRSATIIASCESQLLEIPQEAFYSLLNEHYDFLLSVLKTMCQRARGNIQDLALGYQKIRAQEQLSTQLNQIIDSSPSEILIFDHPSGRLVRANTAAMHGIGYLHNELHKLTLLDILKDISRDEFIAKMDPLISGKNGTLSFRTVVQRKNGNKAPTEVVIHPMGHATESLFLAIFKGEQTSHSAALNQSLSNNYDTLTGLPNRNLVNDRIQFFQAYAERHDVLFTIIVLDIDNFKTLNEALGPQAGDELLKLVAKRLVQYLRKEDTAARLGSDEFLLLLILKEEQDASRMAKKLLQVFDRAFVVGNEEVRISVSLGISMYPHDGHDSITLLLGADAAMHRAKEQGKNTFQFYNASLLTRAANQLKIENALYRALEQEEFVLYYQPKVSTADFRIMGVEALLRWQHPERGLVPPGEFIPIAESSRLIIPLGEWILETACKAIQEWSTYKLEHLSVAVNISGYQFNHSNLLQTLEQILHKTKIFPGHLELELTETILLDDSKGSMDRIHQLREMGVQLAIDDFGTGYSSLTYLRDLPVHNLKIDRSFVHNIRHERNLAIIQAIITLAQALKLKTTAEGVENEDERELLNNLNCDQIQGYLFCRPIPFDEISQMLKESARS